MARQPACATFQRPAGAIGSEGSDPAGDVVAELLPPEGGGVCATLIEMLRAIAQPIVQINLICAPSIKLDVEQSVAIAGRTLRAPTGGARNAAHSGTYRCTTPRIATDCAEGGSRGGASCCTANRTSTWTDSSTGGRIGWCGCVVAGGRRALGVGWCHA